MKRFILVICSETAVVAPLETLNTNLNYRILDDFIGKITDSTTKYYTPTSFDCDNSKNILVNDDKLSSSPKHIPYGRLSIFNTSSNNFLFTLLVSTNRFSVHSVDSNNSTFGNNKKLHVGFGKVTQYSINTITELPEKTLDEER
ncbi:unnamed protein product [Rotaria sp. Silwood2]|nr:unnamed protein product [Rotaria sp. Silwood2]